MMAKEKVFLVCDHCAMRKDCFLAEYVKSTCVLIASLFWPKDKEDWPFDPTETKETLHRNIAAHCKNFIDDSQ
jgi:hypothetical protein